MTIKEFVKRKKKLEQDIKELILAFEKETGVPVEYLEYGFPFPHVIEKSKNVKVHISLNKIGGDN